MNGLLEIIQHVVRKRIKRAVQHERGVDGKTNRVAIRPRADSAPDANASFRTSDVFDNNGLSQWCSHPLDDDAREGIRWIEHYPAIKPTAYQAPRVEHFDEVVLAIIGPYELAALAWTRLNLAQIQQLVGEAMRNPARQ